MTDDDRIQKLEARVAELERQMALLLPEPVDELRADHEAFKARLKERRQ